MLKNNYLRTMKDNTVLGNELFAPDRKSMYRKDFSPFYYTKAKKCFGRNDDNNVESTELYSIDNKQVKGLTSWMAVQDTWTKTDARKRYNQQFPPTQINYGDPQFRYGGKKLSMLSPAVMYRNLWYNNNNNNNNK